MIFVIIHNPHTLKFLIQTCEKKEMMEEEATVTSSYVFRGVEYIVTMVVQGGNTLSVEVEDRLTADQWRATFDSACKIHILKYMLLFRCFMYSVIELVVYLKFLFCHSVTNFTCKVFAYELHILKII